MLLSKCSLVINICLLLVCLQQFQITNADISESEQTDRDKQTTTTNSDNERGSKKYFFSGNPLIWIEAKQACQDRNMSLLSIEDEKEQDYLNELFISTFVRASHAEYLIWTSGYIDSIWASTGKAFEYSNWGYGYPEYRENEEHCIYITNNEEDPETFLWVNKNCGFEFPYICQYYDEATVDVSVQNDRDFILKWNSFATRKNNSDNIDGAKYYVEEHQRLSWSEAVRECEKKNMTLLEISNEQEQQQLEEFLYGSLNRASYYFWIAGHVPKDDKENDFLWETSREPLTYSKWHDDESSKNGSCLEINNSYHEEISYKAFQWFARDCEEKLLYICEQW